MEWLPDLVRLSDYDGSFSSYLEAIYRIFRRDFITSIPYLGGTSQQCFCNRQVIDGKEAAFWHLISEGPVENERVPDMRRCERIAWPRAIIEAFGPLVYGWRSIRRIGGRDRRRLVLSLQDFSYVVILTELRKGYLLVTAFQVETEHRRTKLRLEYQRAAAEM